MPTYEYRCAKPDCGKNFEVTARMSDAAPSHGPGCLEQNCAIEKKLSRVSAWVKGGAVAKESAKAALKDQAIIRTQGPGNEPAAVKKIVAQDDPVHVCSKYCSHHSKV